MTPQQLVISEATKWIGTVEAPAGSNKVIFAAELDKIERPPIPRNGSPWCASFIKYNFWATGQDSALAGVRCFSTMADIAAWKRLGRLTTLLLPGDLAYHRTTATSGHVGLVVSASGGQCTTLEGNTVAGNGGSQTNGGQVARRTRPLSFWSAGFARPFYVPLPTIDPLEDLVSLTACGSACKRNPDGRMGHYRAVVNPDGTITVVGLEGATMKNPNGDSHGLPMVTFPVQPFEFLGLVGPVPDHGGVAATYGTGIWLDVLP